MTRCAIRHTRTRCHSHTVDVQGETAGRSVVATGHMLPCSRHARARLHALVSNPAVDALIAGIADFHTIGIRGAMTNHHHGARARTRIDPGNYSKTTRAGQCFTKAESALTIHFEGMHIVVGALYGGTLRQRGTGQRALIGATTLELLIFEIGAHQRITRIERLERGEFVCEFALVDG